MSRIPKNCTVCPYEASCNSAIGFADCHFYHARKEKNKISHWLKNLFGKFFK